VAPNVWNILHSCAGLLYLSLNNQSSSIVRHESALCLICGFIFCSGIWFEKFNFLWQFGLSAQGWSVVAQTVN